MPDKPPYKIPTVRAALRRKRNGYTVIGTFSGCGGSSLGLTLSGWHVAAAAEFLAEAVESYQANFPKTPIETRDLRAVHGQDLLDLAGVAVGELDLLEGSPPCDPFSTAGAREKKWGEEKSYMGGRKRQQTDDLFFEWARLAGEIQPRAFIAENVSGLAIGKARGYLREIIQTLRNYGYRVEARMLNGKWLGVPQARKRIFIQGIRKDLDADPAWPDPLPYFYSINDALPWIGGVNYADPDAAAMVQGPQGFRKPRAGEEEPADRPARTVLSSSPIAMLVQGPQGNFSAEGRELPADQPARTILGQQPISTLVETGLVAGQGTPSWGRKRGMSRAADDAAPTVIAEVDSWRADSGAGLPPGYWDLPVEERGTSIGKDDGRRKLTIGEVRRLCGFPDDYRLTGTYQQRWSRLGMAVPPPMLEALGRSIAGRLAEIDSREI